MQNIQVPQHQTTPNTTQQQQKPNKTNQPEARFTAGAISATVWQNASSGKDGQQMSYHTVSLQRSYKDRDGNWQHTSSMRLNDLPKARLVLSKAYEFLVLKDTESATSHPRGV